MSITHSLPLMAQLGHSILASTTTCIDHQEEYNPYIHATVACVVVALQLL